jgi:hypothetical protein
VSSRSNRFSDASSARGVEEDIADGDAESDNCQADAAEDRAQADDCECAPSGCESHAVALECAAAAHERNTKPAESDAYDYEQMFAEAESIPESDECGLGDVDASASELDAASYRVEHHHERSTQIRGNLERWFAGSEHVSHDHECIPDSRWSVAHDLEFDVDGAVHGRRGSSVPWLIPIVSYPDASGSRIPRRCARRVVKFAMRNSSAGSFDRRQVRPTSTQGVFPGADTQTHSSAPAHSRPPLPLPSRYLG